MKYIYFCLPIQKVNFVLLNVAFSVRSMLAAWLSAPLLHDVECPPATFLATGRAAKHDSLCRPLAKDLTVAWTPENLNDRLHATCPDRYVMLSASDGHRQRFLSHETPDAWLVPYHVQVVNPSRSGPTAGEFHPSRSICCVRQTCRRHSEQYAICIRQAFSGWLRS